MPDEARALSFGGIAPDYHRYRPRTPTSVLDWLVPPGSERVIDLAAGTGALTERLVERVPFVTAVEPDPGMRAVLSRSAPAAVVVEGTAEAIPLPDAEADALFVSSAWHWFDLDRAVPEIARVLRDGATLGVLGTGMDRSVAWVAALRGLHRSPGPGARRWREGLNLPEGSPFETPERHHLRWTQEMPVDDVLSLLGTYSAVIVAPPADQELITEHARALLAEHPATRGRDPIPVPMGTYAWRATRRAR